MSSHGGEGQVHNRGRLPAQPAVAAHAERPEALAEHGRSTRAAAPPHGHRQRSLQTRQTPGLRRTRHVRRLHQGEILSECQLCEEEKEQRECQVCKKSA